MDSSTYYDRDCKPIEMMTWAKLFEDATYKIIKQTRLPNNRWVSTVWLGLDHSFGGSSQPLIFETMVFSKKLVSIKKHGKELDTRRYSTLKEARQGHKEMCEKWRGN